MFKYHYSKMSDLIDARTAYDLREDKAMVLAFNYELVSRATRALTALRKAEELGAKLLGGNSEVREYLKRYVNLPSLPRRLIGNPPLCGRCPVDSGREDCRDRVYCRQSFSLLVSVGGAYAWT